MDELITLQFDGGSRGNPGPAGIGVVLSAADGTPLVTLGRFIGRATNNVAEYTALITAMQEAKKLGARNILIRGDSELIIKQMRGEYRVKHPDMRALYEKAQALLREFAGTKIEHNLRHKNELADKLANLAMDRRGDIHDADGGSAPAPAREAPATAPGGSPAGATAPTPPPAPSKRGDVFSCARCGCVVELRQPSSARGEQLKPFVCQCGMKMKGL